MGVLTRHHNVHICLFTTLINNGHPPAYFIGMFDRRKPCGTRYVHILIIRVRLYYTRWLPGFARVPCNASSPCHGICTQSQGQGPVCEWLVCEYTTSLEVSLPPLLPCSLSFSLNPSSTHFLPHLFPSRRPCLVRSFPRSFPSTTLPLTLPSFTGAPSLPPSLHPSLPPSLPYLPTSLPYLPPLPPSLPPLPPSALTTRPPRPPIQLNVVLHRVCVELASCAE